jgi:hypothetical protein
MLADRRLAELEPAAGLGEARRTGHFEERLQQDWIGHRLVTPAFERWLLIE